MTIPRSSLSLIAKIAVLSVLYTATATLGLMLDAVSGFATLVWPSTGLALAALLLFGYRLWPGVWLGAFVANFWAGAPWPVSFGIATGNTLEAVFGAFALRQLAGFRSSFGQLRHVVGLVVPAALISTLVSASLGVTSLALGGIVHPSRFFESSYVLFPLFVLAAVRFELRGAATLTALVSVFAIFQRFERAVATRDFAGFGLGLWITRQIVEASGGTVEVQSTVGQGSTFTVRLPVNEDYPSR